MMQSGDEQLPNKQNDVSLNKQNEVSPNKQNEVSPNKQNDIIKDNIKDNIEKIKVKDKSSAPELTAGAVNPSQSPPDVKEVGLEQAKQMWGNTFTIDESGYIIFSTDSINVNLNKKFKMRQ